MDSQQAKTLLRLEHRQNNMFWSVAIILFQSLPRPCSSLTDAVLFIWTWLHPERKQTKFLGLQVWKLWATMSNLQSSQRCLELIYVLSHSQIEQNIFLQNWGWRFSLITNSVNVTDTKTILRNKTTLMNGQLYLSSDYFLVLAVSFHLEALSFLRQLQQFPINNSFKLWEERLWLHSGQTVTVNCPSPTHSFNIARMPGWCSACTENGNIRAIPCSVCAWWIAPWSINEWNSKIIMNFYSHILADMLPFMLPCPYSPCLNLSFYKRKAAASNLSICQIFGFQ